MVLTEYWFCVLVLVLGASPASALTECGNQPSSRRWSVTQ
jgi:hypothetical protein